MSDDETPNSRQIFTELSVVLTGFDRAELAATGLLDAHFDTLTGTIGERAAGHLLRAAAEAMRADRGTSAHKALEAEVIFDPRFRPIVLSLIKLWYLGSWSPLPNSYRDVNGATANDVEYVVSAQAYREGLVWTAAGAHPMGAKAPGFGSWAVRPQTAPIEPAGVA